MIIMINGAFGVGKTSVANCLAKNIDNNIYHFCLTAPLYELHSRLKERGEVPDSWAFLQTEKCIKAYENYDFSEYIDTEYISIEEVSQIIIDKINN